MGVIKKNIHCRANTATAPEETNAGRSVECTRMLLWVGSNLALRSFGYIRLVSLVSVAAVVAFVES